MLIRTDRNQFHYLLPLLGRKPLSFTSTVATWQSRRTRMHGYTLDIKESVRHDRSLSHRIIRSFFVLRFHRISFEFFFFFSFSFSNPVFRTEISVSSLTSRFLEYETKSIVRSPAEIFFLESRIRRRLERRSDACGKFEKIKVFFF